MQSTNTAQSGGTVTVTKTIRILHVVRPASGGMRQHVINLVKFLNDPSVVHSIAAPGDFMASLPPDLPLSKRITLDIAPGFGVGDIGVSNKLRSDATGRYDLVHAHGLRAAYITAMACGLGKFMWLYTAHNLVPNAGATRMGLGLVGSKVSAIIAVSPPVKKSLLACGIDGRDIRVVPNGVDIQHFGSLPANARRTLGLEQNVYVVGCIARLAWEKGVDVLLEAAKKLPEARFIVAGDGPEKPRLIASTGENVKLLGRIDDVRVVLAASDVIAIPSREEGQGIVALEAMAAGVPVVASNVGGLASMYTGTDAAQIVPADDEHALASSLRRMGADESIRRRIGASGHELVVEQYDIRKTVQRVHDVYRSILR
jgi:glycosyltransferase involved in cell wall biosynthesis